MKAVIQRVNSATLQTEGKSVSIGQGLVVYFCVEKNDDESLCQLFASKLVKMRIFNDEQGKMNKSVADICGEVLLVSQFTLAADISHGNRPGFSNAELPERANRLYSQTAQLVQQLGVPVQTGVFGADMTITQQNAGPVTIIWDSAFFRH